MAARSRSARGMILTRHAMRGFEFGEELFHVTALALLCLFKALADAFASVGLGCDVEQALIGPSVLDDGFGLAFDGEHHGSLALLELLHEVAGTAAEGGERLDVLGDIKHGRPLFEGSTFLGAYHE